MKGKKMEKGCNLEKSKQKKVCTILTDGTHKYSYYYTN